MTAFRSLIQRHQLAIFFSLTSAIFWLATPLAAASPAVPYFVAGFAPGLVALLIVAIVGQPGGVRALWARLALWRVRWPWYLAALGIPMGVSLLIFGLSLGLSLSATRFSLPTAVLPLLPVIFILAAGEELGWRGYVLPRLLARLPVLVVALLLGLIHALYHLPLWVAPGFPAPSYSFLAFFFTSLAFGIIWTWLYLHTRSVLLATLFHGSINGAANLFFAGLEPAYLSWALPLGYGLAALLIIVISGPTLTGPRGRAA